MKASDIVNKLAERMPLYTADFGESIAITSIVPTGTTALVTTASAHGLPNGRTVAITGADAPVEIDAGTFLRTGPQAVFETLQDHDLTLSPRDVLNGGKTITLSGATESEFNGTFQLMGVANRRKVIIAVDDSGSTTISGSPIVDDANGGIFNGLFTIANVTTLTFEYTLPVAYTLPSAGSAIAQISIRIGAALDINQYIQDVYTKQPANDFQLIVVLGDVSQSKNRNEPTDASSSAGAQRDFTPTLIQTFAVYIILNSTQSLGAAELRDTVEETYIPSIFKSILREEFDTGFKYSDSRCTFTGHGVYAYTGDNGKNKALYVHEVAFEQLASLVESDAAGPVDNVAMRDVGFAIDTNLGTGEMTTTVNLDEEPIT